MEVGEGMEEDCGAANGITEVNIGVMNRFPCTGRSKGLDVRT